MKHVPAGTYRVGSSTRERQELCERYDMHLSMPREVPPD